MDRPSNRSPEPRVEILPPERPVHRDKYAQDIDDRINGFAYPMFVFVIVGFTLGIKESHGWSMGVFCFVLMMAVLELSYRLSKR